MSRGPKWSAREIALLRVHAPQGTREVRRVLAQRSRSSIRQKAKSLGIYVPCSSSGDIEGKRHRGKLPVPKHAHPFVRKVFEEANRQKATIAEISDRAGIRRDRMACWRRYADPRIGELIAVLNVLDLDLVIVTRPDVGETAPA